MIKIDEEGKTEYDVFNEAYAKAVTKCQLENCCHVIMTLPKLCASTQAFCSIQSQGVCSIVPSLPYFNTVKNENGDNLTTAASTSVASWKQKLQKL